VEYDETAQVELPPAADTEPMVLREVRLPVDLDQRVRVAADKAGVKASILIPEWIELGLTELENDRPVSLSALRRAIAHAAQAVPGTQRSVTVPPGTTCVVGEAGQTQGQDN
jgi:chromosomal replication initiator protein